LLWRTWRGQAPTGIDRVCLAYAAHYRMHAQAVIQRDGMRWIPSPHASAALFEILLDGGKNIRRRLAALAIRVAPTFLERTAHDGWPYLNVGHTGLNRPGVRHWIRRSKVRPIYMVHDLIPLTHPEYCRPGEGDRHGARMATMLETGAGIIANSRATLDTLAGWANARALPIPPALVAWLGTEPLPSGSDTSPLDGPYFVTLGTIEGRKNHLLLLNIWRTLAERLGPATPKLVVIGQRGWEASQATAMLDRCTALRDHVVEISGCDDGVLARYLTHAAALLFPSFVEGYGMPLTEALAMGTPVIASDLTVFRELAGDIPCYRDPLDGTGWVDAVLDYANGGGADRSRQLKAIRHYRAPNWDEHFDAVDRWLDAIL
jgi:glycosyltransferase involved in cell wall biosynthesis